MRIKGKKQFLNQASDYVSIGQKRKKRKKGKKEKLFFKLSVESVRVIDDLTHSRKAHDWRIYPPSQR